MAEKLILIHFRRDLQRKNLQLCLILKRYVLFFTWSGVVSIGSGILICSEYGKVCQSVLRAGGSLEEVNQLWAVKLNMLFMIFDIVMGILLIKRKQQKWRIFLL